MYDNETLHPSESIVLLNVRLSPAVEGIMLLHVGLTRAD